MFELKDNRIIMRAIKALRRRPARLFNDLTESFSLTDEQKLIKETALNFAKERIMPHALEWDLKGHFPEDVVKSTAELGFAGIYLPEAVGGSGLGRMEASIIFEALAYGCPSTSAYISIHNMINWVIGSFGSEEQKQEYCTKLSSMEYLATYCLTEPNSGSDAAAMKTMAKEDGDDFVINGSKMFISGGSVADINLLMCLTGPKEISAIIVPKDAKGLSFGKREHKMGWKNQPTTLVMFEDCRVNKRNLIGKRGDGFRFAMKALNGGRVNIASCSLGGAQFALDKAIEYTNDRKQFGKRISDFQNTQFKLAEFATKLLSSKLMVRAAAQALDSNDKDQIALASMAKLQATDQCFEIVDGCLQLFGGYGYLHEYGIEKVLRDLRVHRILEGTNEIMRVLIHRNLIKQ